MQTRKTKVPSPQSHLSDLNELYAKALSEGHLSVAFQVKKFLHQSQSFHIDHIVSFLKVCSSKDLQDLLDAFRDRGSESGESECMKIGT